MCQMPGGFTSLSLDICLLPPPSLSSTQLPDIKPELRHCIFTEVMSILLSNLTIPSTTVIGQDETTVFSPYFQTVQAISTAVFQLQERSDESCTQTVEVPVWYGSDYNTCSMQAMTAPCSVSFPATSCHTHLPPSQPPPKNGLSDTAKLWIIIGLSIFFAIFVPITVLWTRWNLSTRRRGGKRSISVQLEKNESTKIKSKESAKSKTASKPTSTSSSGSGRHPKIPSGRRTLLDRLLGRRQGGASQNGGKSFQ